MRSSASSAPTARGGLLTGSALDLRRDALGTYERARREHGDIVRFVIGPPTQRKAFYGFFHPDAVHHVLATEADRYRKDSRFYQEIRWALGDGLLTSQDDTWLRQRRFVQPLFTRRRIAGYAASMAEEARQVAERWRPQAVRGRPIDLHAEMSRLTLRVVGRLLFGTDVERAVPVVASTFPTLGGYARTRAFSPVTLPRTWPTPANRRAARAQAAIHDVCRELIAARRTAGRAGEDLLSLLVAARDDGAQLDDSEIRDQVLIFMLAGHDTTAIALTFALQLLGRHPDAQRRVREEIDAVLGDRPPTENDYASLAYTTMVVKEAMRLYPPAWAVGRRTADGDRIAGHDLPPGTEVVVTPWVTHRHPGFWEEPEHFEPERFTPEREATRHRHAYFPFGAGPRACIGQYFSMLEAVIALAVIFQHYELQTDSAPVALDPKITLHPAGPVPCQLTPRAPATERVRRASSDTRSAHTP